MSVCSTTKQFLRLVVRKGLPERLNSHLTTASLIDTERDGKIEVSYVVIGVFIFVKGFCGVFFRKLGGLRED